MVFIFRVGLVECLDAIAERRQHVIGFPPAQFPFATILHCLGINPQRLTHKFRGINVRLTGVEEAHVVKGILA